MRLKILLLFLTLISSDIKSQTRTQAFDSLFNYLKLTDDFNGNVLFAENGKTIYKKSFGYADFASSQLLNDNSMFDLASLSKQFTAMGILILMERQKLKLEDRVNMYLTDIPYGDVTIKNLLTHTSGAPNYMDLFEKYWDKSKVAVNMDVLNLLKEYKPPPRFSPGNKFEYSNTGYVLLALIIEKVANESYSTFLSENIFKPLKMTRTAVLFETKDISNYAKGYIIDKTSKAPVWADTLKEKSFVFYLGGVVGDGGIKSSIVDLFKWDRALRTNKLVQSSTLEEIFSPSKNNNGDDIPYGYGWGLRVNEPVTGKFAYHLGSNPGYDNFINRFIDNDKTIIILRNITNHNKVSGIYEAYGHILFNEQFKLPKIEKKK